MNTRFFGFLASCSLATLALAQTLPVTATAAAVPTPAAAGGVAVLQGGPTPIYTPSAPPAPLAEQPTASPGAGYVWLPGRYTWATDRWAWIPGGWVLPPRADARWINGSWNPQSRQWIEGHWQVASSPTPAASVVVPSTPAPTLATEQELVVLEAPPAPPEAEVRTPPPGPGHVWISGYWGWENGRRQWFRGHWERPPRGYTVWVAPRWEQRPNGWAFVRGYWM